MIAALGCLSSLLKPLLAKTSSFPLPEVPHAKPGNKVVQFTGQELREPITVLDLRPVSDK